MIPEVVSLCSFPWATTRWRRGPAGALTVRVEIAYSLVHGGEAQVESDGEGADDPPAERGGARASGGLAAGGAPLKPAAEVLLVGHAYAADPVTHLAASIAVGGLSKSVRVVGDRRWRPRRDGLLVASAPEPFTRVPLTHELAQASALNPVGVDLARAPVAGALARPNLEPVGGSQLACFAAIDLSWRLTAARLPASHAAWALRSVDGAAPPPEPAPLDFDFSIFNEAPTDQQLEVLDGRESIVLTNVHPDVPRFETRLPGVRPRLYHFDPVGLACVELELRADTLLLDPDHERATLTFRAVLEEDRIPGKLVIAAERAGRRVRAERVAQLVSGRAELDGAVDEPDDAAAPEVGAGAARGDAAPYDAEADAPTLKRRDVDLATRDVSPLSVARPVLPFRGGEPGAPRRRDEAAVEPDVIARCGAVAARLRDAGPDRAAVLAAAGLSESALRRLELRCARALATATDRGDTSLLVAYDDAYLAELGTRRSISAAVYARVVLAVERGDADAVLRAHDLVFADVARLERVWARRMAEDPRLRAETVEAMAAERARAGRRP